MKQFPTKIIRIAKELFDSSFAGLAAEKDTSNNSKNKNSKNKKSDKKKDNK